MTDLDPTVAAIRRAIKDFGWHKYNLDEMPTDEPDWINALADRVFKTAEVEESRWMVAAQAERIAELEHAVERLAGVPLADASPQLREWLANVTPPVGPGKVDTPDALQRRIDEATPGAVVELRAAVAERDGIIARLLADRDEALNRLDPPCACKHPRADHWALAAGGLVVIHAAECHRCAGCGIYRAVEPTTTPAVPEKETTS